MKCPNCGADIEQNSKICSYCNSAITVEMQRNQEQLNKSGCPKCGSSNITFKRENQGEVRGKKGKQIVHKTVGLCKDCGYTWNPNVPVQKKESSNMWLWVVGWIVIFPVPLTLLMLRNKTMKTNVRYGIIAGAWVLYLLIAFAGMSRKQDKDSSDSTANKVETNVTESESNTETKPEEKTEAKEAEADESFDFVITVGQAGEYGFENTLNAGTEFEETQIVYHIPAGKYKVKYMGSSQGQISAYSDSTHKNEDGWEEPEDTKDVAEFKPNETVDFKIEDGYYLEVQADGQLGFTKSK